MSKEHPRRKFGGLPRPRHTQTPSVVYSDIMCELNLAEYRVLSYLILRIIGFHRPGDAEEIPLEQIVNGWVLADGRRMDRGVELNVRNVQRALRELEEMELVEIVPTTSGRGGSGPNLYRLRFNEE